MFETDAFSRSLFFPREELSARPAFARDVSVPVDDGVTLHLRIHDADATPTPRAWVLLFHGNGEIVADYDGEPAARFRQAGAALAVVDYRGYGASEGAPTFANILEDAPLVLEALAREVEGPIVVMGRSLGSACANHLVPLCGASHPRVVGFMLESGFSDLDAMARRRGMNPHDVRADERAHFDPLPKLARAELPMLVLHGGNDALVLVREAHAAFAAIGTPAKELVVLADRGHNDLSRAPAYWAAMQRFLAR